MLIAWLLNSQLRGQIAVRSLVFLPVVLGATDQRPDLVRDVQSAQRAGHADLLAALRYPRQPARAAASTALYAVIWVQIWANLGFSMMVFLAGMQAIPSEIYEAGKIDGTVRLERLPPPDDPAAGARASPSTSCWRSSAPSRASS